MAEELFTEHGYAATSLDAIVAGARVTKGALYHHFSGKQALFEAVFERVEADAVAGRSRTRSRATGTRGRRRGPGCGAFLEVVQEPRYRRIVIQDGPAVLGYERFREQEERSTFANVLDIVRAVLERRRPASSTRRCCRPSPGSSSARCRRPASRSRRADDPIAAAERVETAIGFILAGLQALADDGARAADRRTPASRLLLEGDVAAVGRDQLDPDVAGGTVSVAGLGGQLERRGQARPSSRCRGRPGRRGRAAPGPCRRTWSPGTGLPAGSR